MTWDKQHLVTGMVGGILGSALTVAVLISMPAVSQTTPTDVSAPAAGPSVADVVKRANPAVVSIVISKDVPVLERYFDDTPTDPFGDEFPFFQTPKVRQNGTEKRDIGGGSGFLVSADGYIITNKHVVADKDAEYTVFTNDGQKHSAKVIARDPVTDIAVMKVEGTGFPFLTFSDSDAIDVGQTAIAIGNALGEFRNTVSVGVISGLSRSITAGDGSGTSERLEGVIQTDAAINPGNSGGPLLDLTGKVVGVNVAVGSGENIGFALPANLVSSVVTSVKETGKIVRPFLGVRYLPVTEEVKQKNSLTVDYGVLVARGPGPDEPAVLPGSAADKAGITENDVLLAIDGAKIDEDHSLASLIRNTEVGDRVQVTILRKGEERVVQAELQAIPE